MTAIFDNHRDRAEIIANLRRRLPKLEHSSIETRAPFGRPEIDAHLPRGGLASDGLHEIAPRRDGDEPCAFGFAAAIAQIIAKPGLVLFIASPQGLKGSGEPHGHGLNAIGLNPSQVMFVSASNEIEALWALEESLNSCAPVVIIGAIGNQLSLKQSQRLSVAAGKSGIPLLLLRPARSWGSTAASTRWRISGAEAARDRFGLITRTRWRARLERCRNGKPGEWLVEWDHVAHCFSLAVSMADSEISGEPGKERRAAGTN